MSFTVFQGGNLSPVFSLSEDFKYAKDQIENREVQTANIVNNRTIGIYNTAELVNAEQYFTASNAQVFRPVYRKVINFGALPNSTTKTSAHGITLSLLVRLYGASTDPATPQYIPIPYASTTAVANNVELWMDATNINVKTGTNMTAYTTTYIVVEYLK